MPLFNPYDEEERRKRLLTPGFNPNAGLPEAALPNRPMLPPPGNPGGMPAPGINRQSRYGEVNEARDAYLQKTPGRGRSALTEALRGFAQGGLRGAIIGGARGAIDPRGVREEEFNQRIKPQIQERFGYEDQAAAVARQAEQDALNNQYRTAQIGELESQAYKNRLPPPAPRPRSPVHSDRGLYDPEAGQIIPGTEPLPKVEKPPSRIVRNAAGDYVDYYEEKSAGRKVKGYDRPRAPKEPKAEARPKPGSKGNATKEDIDAAFRAAGGHAAGWTLKGMKKHLKDKGYTVPE